MADKDGIRNEYKQAIKKAFQAGYKAKSQFEALETLSETFANELESYTNKRIIEINKSDGVADVLVRTQLKLVLDEISKIVIVEGRGVDKAVINQIKNKL